jgi:glycosyltransferase involved in cell wall biosynthesis
MKTSSMTYAAGNRLPKADSFLKVHLWSLDVAAVKGGIQAYSRHLINAVQAVVGPDNLQVFSKNDTRAGLNGFSSLRCNGSGDWPRRLRNPAFVCRILRAVLVDRPDLIILTHLNLGPVAYWLARLAGTRYWSVAHGVEAWKLKRRAQILALRAADRILAVSSYTRERIIHERSLNPDQVRILPNTIQASAFQPAPKPETLLKRHGIAPQKKVILTVARLADSEQYKGYDQILRALPKVLSAVPESHYVLVGEGGDRGRVEKLIESLGVRAYVTLAGSVPQRELVDYYNLCDLFAMPSKGEGFGIVFLEALACGKPVLAGNVDGSSEPLQHGRLGVLIDPENVNQIADSLIAILTKTYPLPVLYQPEELRRTAINAFGFERFSAEVAHQLSTFQTERARTIALRANLSPPAPMEGESYVWHSD